MRLLLLLYVVSSPPSSDYTTCSYPERRTNSVVSRGEETVCCPLPRTAFLSAPKAAGAPPRYDNGRAILEKKGLLCIAAAEPRGYSRVVAAAASRRLLRPAAGSRRCCPRLGRMG